VASEQDVREATRCASRPERHPNRQPLILKAEKIPRPEKELMAKGAGAGEE
jgi:hypothetical protein